MLPLGLSAMPRPVRSYFRTIGKGPGLVDTCTTDQILLAGSGALTDRQPWTSGPPLNDTKVNAHKAPPYGFTHMHSA